MIALRHKPSFSMFHRISLDTVASANLGLLKRSHLQRVARLTLPSATL